MSPSYLCASSALVGMLMQYFHKRAVWSIKLARPSIWLKPIYFIAFQHSWWMKTLMNTHANYVYSLGGDAIFKTCSTNKNKHSCDMALDHCPQNRCFYAVPVGLSSCPLYVNVSRPSVVYTRVFSTPTGLKAFPLANSQPALPEPHSAMSEQIFTCKMLRGSKYSSCDSKYLQNRKAY